MKENGLDADTVIPVEMLCASGSGLDPHISPDAARLQVERIVRQRHMDAYQKQLIYQMIKRETEQRQWSVLGQVRINVFKLNLLLDNNYEFRNFNGNPCKYGEPYAGSEETPGQ